MLPPLCLHFCLDCMDREGTRPAHDMLAGAVIALTLWKHSLHAWRPITVQYMIFMIFLASCLLCKQAWHHREVNICLYWGLHWGLRFYFCTLVTMMQSFQPITLTINSWPWPSYSLPAPGRANIDSIVDSVLVPVTLWSLIEGLHDSFHPSAPILPHIYVFLRLL